MIERIGFVGGGVMAEAFIRGLLATGTVKPGQVLVGDPIAERRAHLAREYGVSVTDDNQTVVAGAPVVVLAIKPQQMTEALVDARVALSRDQLVLSIAAGVSLRTISDGLAHDQVVRIMPNTPAQVGAGMSVWTATTSVGERGRQQVRLILQSLGREAFVADERYLDMATAINGSGPAYIFLFIEAMIDAAVHIGLPRSLAEELVVQTALGSAHMARETGKHPAVLRNLVTSPGGTTAEGLRALEAGRLRAVVDQAVVAAYERSQQLGT